MRARLPFLVLPVLLLAVLLARFDRRELLPPGALWAAGPAHLSDAANYSAYVGYFRGEGSRREVRVPFLYRPLTPLLAAPLPFPARTAINVLNVLLLELALLLLLWRLSALGFGLALRWPAARSSRSPSRPSTTAPRAWWTRPPSCC